MLPQPHRLQVGQLMGQALRVSLRYLPGFLLVALVVQAPALLLEIGQGPSAEPATEQAVTTEELGITLVSMVLDQLLGAALAFATVLRQEGRACSGMRAMEASFGRMFPILFIAMIPGIAFFASTYVVVLLIPAVFLFITLYVAVPVLMLEDAPVIHAMRRSAYLTRGNRFNIFIAISFVLLSTLLITQFLARAELGTIGSLAAATVAGSLLAIFSSVVLALIYLELRRHEFELPLPLSNDAA